MTKAALDRQAVTRAALDLLDEVGLDRLSTRRLAERLDVRSPALYWHFRDKQELLDLMARELLHGGADDPDGAPEPEDWPVAAAATARDRRHRLLSRRDGARLVAGTRPGVEQARAAEEGIAVLVAAGLEPRAALQTMLAIGHFVTGFVLEEQAAAGRAAGPSHAAPGTYPLLTAAVADGRPEDDAAFEHGLGALIDGLSRRVPGRQEGERT